MANDIKGFQHIDSIKNFQFKVFYLKFKLDIYSSFMFLTSFYSFLYFQVQSIQSIYLYSSQQMYPKSVDIELWNNLKSRFAASRMQMLQSNQLTINNRTMKFEYKTKGSRPASGYTLIFGLHGGGGCPAQTNNQQHNNHKCLYDNNLPNGTIWFAPRSIEDVWDMWFKDYMEDFLLQIVRAFALNDLIDVNKVFITGYSAGGDGVYHLAPRMADYLAGAAMMAGHPNGINFMNIRNIGFSVQVGEKDNAYNRRNEAIKYIRMLAQLQQNYGGFENVSKIQPGKPHWMDRQDARVFDWLLNFTRDPYPQVILFKQCPRRRQTTFYYLRIGQPKNGNREQQTVVVKQGNTFKITSNRPITVLVNSKMIDPSIPITIFHNNSKTVERIFQPKPEVAQQTLLERIDPYYIFEDQLLSVPPQVIDIKATICDLFSISSQEKDAEYQKSLPIKPEETPSNFNMGLGPLIMRTKPLLFGKGRRRRGSGMQIGGQTGIQIGGGGQQPNYQNQYPPNQNNNFFVNQTTGQQNPGWQSWNDTNQNVNNQWQGQGQNNQGYQQGQGGGWANGGQRDWENQAYQQWQFEQGYRQPGQYQQPQPPTQYQQQPPPYQPQQKQGLFTGINRPQQQQQQDCQIF